MKRKLACLALIVVMAIACALAFTACNGNEGNTPTSSEVYTVETAYEQAKNLGYTGTLEEFTDFIQGKAGNNGIASVTVNEQGELVVTATDGSILYQGKLPICEHSWSKWELKLEPTCTSVGYNTRTCAICGYVEYDFKEELGHTFGEWRDVTNTCTSHFQMKVCSVCGDTQLNEAQPKGHTWVQGKCIICGQTELDNLEINRLNLYNGTYGYEYLGTMEKGKSLQKFYKDIENAVMDFHVKGQDIQTNVFATINYVEYGLTDNEAISVWKTFKDDNPLYYWLSNAMQVNGDKIVLMTEEEYKNGEARTTKNKVVYDAIAEYTSLVNDSDSEYRIALAYHDAIINAVDYAYSSDGEPETAYWAHSIIGVFEEKGAVCEGYARTYQLLLNVSGVENLFVSGMGNSEQHAWNTVRLDDGNWYWCDLTWDDVPRYYCGIQYQYFCALDEEFLKKHKIDVSSASGVEFLYELPKRSDKPYENSDQTMLNDKFTVDNCDYTVIGYNTVELSSIVGAGSVTIPETVSYNGITYSVVSLGGGANGLTESILNSDITEVFVPKSIRFIWDNALSSFSLKSITVDEDNKYFRSVDGVLYTKSLYTLIQFPSAKEVTSYTIPDDTVQIAHVAFNGCEHLQTLYVGKNVEIVGITNWGSGYKDENDGYGGDLIIGEWNIIMQSLSGDGEIIIDKENPYYISDEVAIYDSLKTTLYVILDRTITTYQLPKTVYQIDLNLNAIFSVCTKLQSITVEENNLVFSAEGGILYDVDKTQIVYVPTAIEGTVTIPDSMTFIGDKLFSQCYKITNIILPNTITSIGYRAFEHCKSLTSITIPNSVTSIGNSVFVGCVSLTSITIPNSVTSIGNNAFSGCASLTSVTLQNSITSIGNSAFEGCVKLTNIIIPSSVTSIGNNAFNSCSNLTSIYYLGTETTWNAIEIGGLGSYEIENATKYFYSETEPTTNGNYWHYDENGKIVVWKKQ